MGETVRLNASSICLRPAQVEARRPLQPPFSARAFTLLFESSYAARLISRQDNLLIASQYRRVRFSERYILPIIYFLAIDRDVCGTAGSNLKFF